MPGASVRPSNLALMTEQTDLIGWARERAAEIESATYWYSTEYGSYWALQNDDAEDELRASSAAAVAFISEFAGASSTWTKHAAEAFSRSGKTTGDQARELAGILREWAAQVERGLVGIPRLAAASRGAIAASDLMGQVHVLIEDGEAHPAAAIVLAGAALELRTRAALEARELEVLERPSLAAYYRRLRQEGLITAQNVKEFDVVAGLRNDAAHDHFEALSKERAGLMEQQVVLLLRMLDELDQSQS